MPLTERDVNTPRDLPRAKSHSAQRDTSYHRLNDENSPRTASKTTPPSQRLLAPTKSSAAKVSTPPRTHQTGQNTPHSLPLSRLPRRTPPPGAVFASTKGTRREFGPLVAVNDASITATGLPKQKTVPKPSGESGKSSSSSSLALNAAVEGSSLSEKTLPSRPVASQVSALSPSKHSRSLLDASEKPLTLIIAGDECDWPTLTPRSASAGPTNGSHLTEKAAKDRTLSQKFSPGVAQCGTSTRNTFTHPRSHTAAGQGSVLSPAVMPAETSGSRPQKLEAVTAQHYDGSDDAATSSNCTDTKDPETFSAKRNDRIVSEEKIRQHTPSPANFSRPKPRPTSTLPSRLPSPSPSSMPSTTAAAAVTRNQKTASRIPIPDTKKATLVDIRSRRSSAALSAKIDHAKGPSFGRGRLDAPEALKILDQGMKRRQLKRTDTNDSTMTSATASTRVFAQAETTSLDYDRSSTPDCTNGPSSSDEEEVFTPTDRPNEFWAASRGLQRAPSFCIDGIGRFVDKSFESMNRAPPSNSPYTEPLQTIPSQSAFPTSDVADAALQRSSSKLAAMRRRLSNLQSEHADYTAVFRHGPVPESTRVSLIELLNEYGEEDARLSRDGCATLDDDARKHITSTLFTLEGKGGSPTLEVDNETLHSMFGHLRACLEKTPKTASFYENAVVAQKYLNQPESLPQRLHLQHGLRTEPSPVMHHFEQSTTSSQTPIVPVASKWSESSTSAQDGVSGIDHISPRNTQHIQLGPAPSVAKPGPLRSTPPDAPRSIGYPSRIPDKVNALLGPGDSGVATPLPVRRTSSPTLGKRKPGSVRTARETMVRGGFARTTASAESKKSSKTPTSTGRPLTALNEMPRGRSPSNEKPRSKSDAAGGIKTPRARSKSKQVLNKISGLFSNRRLNQNRAVPPVPALEKDGNHHRGIAVTANGSPVLKMENGSILPSLPGGTPPNSNGRAPHSNSRASNSSPETLVNSVAGNEEFAGLKDLTSSLTRRAHRESDMQRRQRLLMFAKVLNDSVLSAQEAKIASEKARQAANSAKAHYEMTQKSIEMLHRLASALGRN
ncbi:hypothetical protein KC332_g3144 [Hortaea werneckii]|uniref:Uncharacterized protein n=2 Tax=Hortaea werneckii TaxID=91943 RepID=A0A3M7I9N5_HORWE|nr:hypothetical protein KC358_g7975 [Hortaea werneckii]OTA24834.1 hypothetical protein BTJ68_13479 [Hortaea werneckii EXF-2000]KAI6831092.1 hypothetical protein KC350_g7428 [Hortaea werneckii]KAI6927214.1 hypothetical protein KC348_g8454 [Hortaea werneckii]KAI6934090.1 hypothetical protein KC341_g7839 [Hortaea werneckii]